MHDVNRRMVERFWEAFNDRDLSLLDDLFAEDYVEPRDDSRHAARSAGQAQLMQRLWTAFPDARFEIEHLAQDADTVVCVGTMAGTHEGELFGIPGRVGQARRVAPVSPHHRRGRQGDDAPRDPRRPRPDASDGARCPGG